MLPAIRDIQLFLGYWKHLRRLFLTIHSQKNPIELDDTNIQELTISSWH